MSQDNDDVFKLALEDEFNEKASFLCDQPYDEIKKFMSFFEKNMENYGPDSFSPTVVVHSMPNKLVGIVTCRETRDKEDLYKALSEMLFFPSSIQSELFILGQDAKITTIKDKTTKSEVTEALVVSFVTPDNCLIATLPYTYNDQNKVTWYLDNAYGTRIHVDSKTDNLTGDMTELFYVYSHLEQPGPFTPVEILRYFDVAGYNYQIFDDKYVTNTTFPMKIAFA